MRYDPLMYDREYLLWRHGKYIGIATWTFDSAVGDAFIRLCVGEKGQLIREVFIADEWQLKIF